MDLRQYMDIGITLALLALAILYACANLANLHSHLGPTVRRNRFLKRQHLPDTARAPVGAAKGQQTV